MQMLQRGIAASWLAGTPTIPHMYPVIFEEAEDMTTAILTSERSNTLARIFTGFPSAFSLVLRYKTLFQMNDAELAARGLTREDLNKNFIDEASQL